MKLTKKNLFKALAIALPFTLGVAAILPIVVSCSSTTSTTTPPFTPDTNPTPPANNKILTPDIVKQYTSTGGKWYQKSTIYIDETDKFEEIAELAFDGESNTYISDLKAIDISNNKTIKTIKSMAFSNMDLLETVNLDNGKIEKIESSAFWSIGNKSVNKEPIFTFSFPKSLANNYDNEWSEYGIFDNCFLKEITFPNGYTYAAGLNNYNDLYEGCQLWDNIKLNIPSTVNYIPDNGLSYEISNVAQYLPKSIERIEGDFAICNSFSSNVSHYRDYSFSRLNNLKTIGNLQFISLHQKVILPESGNLVSIGNLDVSKFSNLFDQSRLFLITIPRSVKNVGKIVGLKYEPDINYYPEPMIKIPRELKNVWTLEKSGLNKNQYTKLVEWY